MITLFVYLQVTFVSFIYFSPDGITKFYGRLFLLLHHFTFHFWNGLKLSFCHFTSSLFSIRAFLIFLPLQMASINYLTNKGVRYLFGFINRVYYRFILLYPFLLPNKCVARILGTASYFIAFLFPVVFLLYMTLYQHWKRRKI